jgi:hypothetical protein
MSRGAMDKPNSRELGEQLGQRAGTASLWPLTNIVNIGTSCGGVLHGRRFDYENAGQ